MDAEYLGTLSSIPNHNLDNPVVPTSAKRARGKVRANRREPRDRAIALGTCKVYASREDYDNGKVSYEITRSRKESAAKKREAELVKKYVSPKQEFAEAYRNKIGAAHLDN